MTSEHAGSRLEDSPLYKRLTTLEDHVSTLERQVDRLTNDQKHQSDMSNVQLTLMQKAQELAISKIDALAAAITLMSAEADKSPAGRGLLQAIQEIRDGNDKHDGDARSREERITALAEWQQRVDGVLFVLKWMGASGVAALIWVALRSFGKVP